MSGHLIFKKDEIDDCVSGYVGIELEFFVERFRWHARYKLR